MCNVMEEKIISGIVVAVAVVLFSFNLFSTRDAFYAFWDHESTYTADGYVRVYRGVTTVRAYHGLIV